MRMIHEENESSKMNEGLKLFDAKSCQCNENTFRPFQHEYALFIKKFYESGGIQLEVPMLDDSIEMG